MLIPGSRIKNFCNCMVSFQSLYHILSMVFVEEYDTVIEVLKGGSNSTQQLAQTINMESLRGEIFNALLTKYKAEAKILYQCGHRIFMTHAQRGNRETFYLHTLSNYVPHLM